VRREGHNYNYYYNYYYNSTSLPYPPPSNVRDHGCGIGGGEEAPLLFSKTNRGGVHKTVS